MGLPENQSPIKTVSPLHENFQENEHWVDNHLYSML